LNRGGITIFGKRACKKRTERPRKRELTTGPQKKKPTELLNQGGGAREGEKSLNPSPEKRG